MSNNFIIVVPFYNVEKWITKCVKSIKLQTIKNFQCYLVDDISTDNTVQIIKKIIENDDRFHLLVNQEKKYALKNIYDVIIASGNNAEYIIITLDGDDWFASKKVLEILDKKYTDNRCFMTYGSYLEYPSLRKGKFCRPIEDQTIKNAAYRNSTWVSSHLRTFKRHLWNKIKKEDLLGQDGKFYRMTWDMAFMFPMLEMAGPMALHIPETLYAYNRQNPLNDDKVNHRLQLKTESKIRSKTNYKQDFVSCDILGPSDDISGLGNQLFCVATAISYGIENDKIPFFPQILTDRHIAKFRDKFYKKLSSGKQGDLFHNVHSENNFHYDKIKPMKKNIKLHGYFQSEKYFVKHRPEIIELLNISELKQIVKEKYGDKKDYISIHVRRGDYLTLKDYHHNLDIEYYKKAISFYDKEHKFLIFSNDIAWCKNNFNFIKNAHFSEHKEEWEDMMLMSLCKHNIVANSSFSCWGAWLNTNEDKKVIAPKKWFGPKYSSKDTKDILPESWMAIDV